MHRVALFLLLLLGTPLLAQGQPVQKTFANQSAEGHRLFVQSCAVCHLKPSPTADTYGPALSKETIAGRETDIRALIGKGSERMPGFRYSLEPAQIDAIVAYLATVPTPSAPATSPATTPPRPTSPQSRGEMQND
jgi:mono/diheme cytochrome c family protein